MESENVEDINDLFLKWFKDIICNRFSMFDPYCLFKKPSQDDDNSNSVIQREDFQYHKCLDTTCPPPILPYIFTIFEKDIEKEEFNLDRNQSVTPNQIVGTNSVIASKTYDFDVTSSRHIFREVFYNSTIVHQYSNPCYAYKIEADKNKINFVRIYTVFRPFGSLDKFINMNDVHNPISCSTMLSILFKCTYPFESMHKRNLIHRDIKCQNIFIDEFFNPQIADFGFTRRQTEGENTKLGTFQYMATEILRKEDTYTKRVDTHSFMTTIIAAISKTEPYHNQIINFKNIPNQLPFKIDELRLSNLTWKWMIIGYIERYQEFDFIYFRLFLISIAKEIDDALDELEKQIKNRKDNSSLGYNNNAAAFKKICNSRIDNSNVQCTLNSVKMKTIFPENSFNLIKELSKKNILFQNAIKEWINQGKKPNICEKLNASNIRKDLNNDKIESVLDELIRYDDFEIMKKIFNKDELNDNSINPKTIKNKVEQHHKKEKTIYHDFQAEYIKLIMSKGLDKYNADIYKEASIEKFFDHFYGDGINDIKESIMAIDKIEYKKEELFRQNMTMTVYNFYSSYQRCKEIMDDVQSKHNDDLIKWIDDKNLDIKKIYDKFNNYQPIQNLKVSLYESPFKRCKLCKSKKDEECIYVNNITYGAYLYSLYDKKIKYDQYGYKYIMVYIECNGLIIAGKYAISESTISALSYSFGSSLDYLRRELDYNHDDVKEYKYQESNDFDPRKMEQYSHYLQEGIIFDDKKQSYIEFNKNIREVNPFDLIIVIKKSRNHKIQTEKLMIIRKNTPLYAIGHALVNKCDIDILWNETIIGEIHIKQRHEDIHQPNDILLQFEMDFDCTLRVHIYNPTKKLIIFDQNGKSDDIILD